NGLEVRVQAALGACARGRDHDRVVARDGADDLWPARLVEGDGDTLGRAGRGAQHRQVGARGPVTLDERLHGLEVTRRQRVFNRWQQVSVRALHDAELAQ